MKLGVVGLGAAGLPLAVCLAQKHEVIGVDISQDKVEGVNQKTYYGIEKELKEIFPKANIRATTDLKELKDVEVIIVALPSTERDFSTIEKVVGELNSFFTKDVVVSTTSPICFTKEMQDKNKNITLSYIPMRTFEGKAVEHFYAFPHIIGVFNPETYKKLAPIYEECGCKTSIAKPEEAELAKLLSNTFRQIELAVSNELAYICKIFGADPYIVFKLVNEGDPYRDIKKPGVWAGKKPGVWGGYCLPKDTNMLVNSTLVQRGFIPRLAELAERIRLESVERKAQELLHYGKGRTIGIEGVTCKPIEDKIPDARGSPVIEVIEILKKNNADVKIFDPNLSKERLLEIGNQLGVKVADNSEEVANADVFARFENFDLHIKKK